MKKLNTYNDFVNEGVRDKMSPISSEKKDELIDNLFKKVKEEGEWEVSTNIIYDIWEECTIQYHILDDYYMYKGDLYLLHESAWGDQVEYQLLYHPKGIEDFKLKLEKAIEKINNSQ